MGKQIIRYRTCDKCPGEVQAAVTDKVMFNGSRYDLDLCEKHSLELFSDMMRWLDLGTKTGETGIFDQQKQARPVTVPVETPKAAPVFAEPEPAAPTSVVPIRKIIADDPDLPLTASRWELTRHAHQRIEDRHFRLSEVLWAAERPEWAAASKYDPSLEVRLKGSCRVVVDPVANVVVTVTDKDEDARTEFLDEFLNRNRKAQG